MRDVLQRDDVIGMIEAGKGNDRAEMGNDRAEMGNDRAEMGNVSLHQPSLINDDEDERRRQK